MPRHTRSGVQTARSDLSANREAIRGRRRRQQVMSEVFGLARPLTDDSRIDVHDSVDEAMPVICDLLRTNGYIRSDDDGVFDGVFDRRVALGCTILERIKLRNSLAGVAGVFEMGNAVGKIEAQTPEKDSIITAKIGEIGWLGSGDRNLCLMLEPHPILEEEAKVIFDTLKKLGAKIKNNFKAHVTLGIFSQYLSVATKDEIEQIVGENLESEFVTELDLLGMVVKKPGERED